MKIVIGQPIQESGTKQLKEAAAFCRKADFLLFPEGYLQHENRLEEAKKIAKENKINIVTSYRQEKKDRAVIIGRNGNLLYQRLKTDPSAEAKLQLPLQRKIEKWQVGYLLCMEILKGKRDFHPDPPLDIIFHPIGVGMFSESQLSEWMEEAQMIAIKNHVHVMGTSHADGSYKNCGCSIPILYCVDPTGKQVLFYKNMPQTAIITLDLPGDGTVVN